jgi:hypothetical protein
LVPFTSLDEKEAVLVAHRFVASLREDPPTAVFVVNASDLHQGIAVT